MTNLMKKILAGLLALMMLCSVPGSVTDVRFALAEADVEAALEVTEEPDVTVEPTAEPTEVPTEEPTAEPTEAPTAVPTEEPTEAPTEEPTAELTEAPTEEPTEEPTEAPTEEPTEEPTEAPTEEPTEVPTEEPTAEPTEAPTEDPTEEPTEEPTVVPTEVPTEESTAEPTAAPTEEPAAEFVSGYGWVNKGDNIYVNAGCSKVLGTVSGKSVVWYVDYNEDQGSYKVAFVMDGQVKTGWIREKDAVQMSEGESEAYAQAAEGAYSYNGHALEATAFEPVDEPTAEPTEAPTAEPTAVPTEEPTPDPTAEPTAEPTPEPTPDLEAVLKSKAEAMLTTRPGKGGESSSSKPVEEACAQILLETLRQVTGLQGKPVNTNIIYMKWDAVEGADGYQVLRALSAEGKYTFLKNVDVTEARNYSLTPGTTYYYKVRAYVLNDDGSKTFGELSDHVGISVLANCENFDAWAVDTNAARMTWNAVPGATGYQVFRTVAGTDAYAWVKNSATADADNYCLTPGTTYDYKIRAYIDLPDGTRAYGQFTEGKKVHSLGLIDGLELYGSGNVMVLDWEDVSGITGYQVFCAKDKDEPYIWIKNVSESQAEHYNTKLHIYLGQSRYKIRAYVDQPNGVRAYGRFSNVVWTDMPIPVPRAAVMEYGAPYDQVAIKFEELHGIIDWYDIYRKTADSEWDLVECGYVEEFIRPEAEDGYELFYVDVTAEPNQTYYYCVVSVNAYNFPCEKGRNTMEVSTWIDAPTLLSACGEFSRYGNFYLSFSDEPYIQIREIQYSTSPDSGFQHLAYAKEDFPGEYGSTYYSGIDSLEPGKVYYFRVRNVYESSGKKYYSDWSNVRSAVLPDVSFVSKTASGDTDVLTVEISNRSDAAITVEAQGVFMSCEDGMPEAIQNSDGAGDITIAANSSITQQWTIDCLDPVTVEDDHQIYLFFHCNGYKYMVTCTASGSQWEFVGDIDNFTAGR